MRNNTPVLHHIAPLVQSQLQQSATASTPRDRLRFNLQPRMDFLKARQPPVINDSIPALRHILICEYNELTFQMRKLIAFRLEQASLRR